MNGEVKKTLNEIASFLGGTVVGDDQALIRSVRGIDEAGPGDITFVANAQYEQKLLTTKASAVLVSRDTESPGRNLVQVDDPYAALGRLLALFYPEEKEIPAVSGRAMIEEGAEIAPSATVYPGVYVGRGARIEAGAVLYPGVFIGREAVIGEDSVLYPNVCVYRRCLIGRRVILHAGAVVGSDGFGFANPGRDNLKIPQIGIVQIDDDVEIGSNTTIDRATLGRTWIQRGVKIDNLVQIAHNVVIGEKSIIVSQVGISGSTHLGQSVILGGQAGLVGHLDIGDFAMVGAQSGVHEDVKARSIVSGSPCMPHRTWLRAMSCVPRLPEMRTTLNHALKRLEALEGQFSEHLEKKK
ncbi:MAG: UDP-3-O-acylglucosamine N-acyltransferase [Syntrophus sp. PtaU1.Bin005]|jgi:UDP-3-O-[3-hydroxymyristoyl] glucosamine N-acyltransferase|nr:MAG: UDP-3-O-acylglucosamine N-acyltransferase [Syntrophus sp. PtaB.Bin138]OPY82084.1 MAG: UDP-3-O-acylglucosamine N-acyltransferase [Syntrophus sp. PtaU1.Bin005]